MRELHIIAAIVGALLAACAIGYVGCGVGGCGP